jgi:hypothetical protein
MKTLSHKLYRHQTRYLRYPLNWLLLIAGFLLVLTGCGGGSNAVTSSDTAMACKMAVELGDSTSRGRGDLVGQSLQPCDIYVNRGYDGQTTAQAVNGLDGANGFTGATFADSMASLKAFNNDRRNAKIPLPEYRIIIVINEGINDRLHGSPIDDSISNISIMVSQAKAQGFEVVIVLPNKLCLDLGMSEYVNKLRALRLPVADVYTLNLNIPDCIHPDQAGREAAAKVIAAKLVAI